MKCLFAHIPISLSTVLIYMKANTARNTKLTLPTVAAYIIGAILFVPALLNLGIPELAAHFFVMYYCVLSMITPPVALASYTAAGMAGTFCSP